METNRICFRFGRFGKPTHVCHFFSKDGCIAGNEPIEDHGIPTVKNSLGEPHSPGFRVDNNIVTNDWTQRMTPRTGLMTGDDAYYAGPMRDFTTTDSNGVWWRKHLKEPKFMGISNMFPEPVVIPDEIKKILTPVEHWKEVEDKKLPKRSCHMQLMERIEVEEDGFKHRSQDPDKPKKVKINGSWTSFNGSITIKPTWKIVTRYPHPLLKDLRNMIKQIKDGTVVALGMMDLRKLDNPDLITIAKIIQLVTGCKPRTSLEILWLKKESKESWIDIKYIMYLRKEPEQVLKQSWRISQDRFFMPKNLEAIATAMRFFYNQGSCWRPRLSWPGNANAIEARSRVKAIWDNIRFSRNFNPDKKNWDNGPDHWLAEINEMAIVVKVTEEVLPVTQKVRDIRSQKLTSDELDMELRRLEGDNYTLSSRIVNGKRVFPTLRNLSEEELRRFHLWLQDVLAKMRKRKKEIAYDIDDVEELYEDFSEEYEEESEEDAEVLELINSI